MWHARSLALAFAVLVLLGCSAPGEAPPPATTLEPSAPATVEPAIVAPSPSPSPETVLQGPGASPTPTPAASPTPTTAGPEPVLVGGTGHQGLNLRQEPGPQGRILRALRDGTELTIVGPDREVDGRAWRNVRDASGTTGWVIGEALEVMPATAQAAGPPGGPNPTPSTATSGRARVTGGQGANLREEPGGRVLKTVREGTELTIIGPDREVEGRAWRKVRDADETTGWVAAEALEPIAEPTPPQPTPTPSPADLASPCRVGQIKGDATSGLYFLLTHPEYGSIRERARCFDSEAQARASGFRPAP